MSIPTYYMSRMAIKSRDKPIPDDNRPSTPCIYAWREAGKYEVSRYSLIRLRIFHICLGKRAGFLRPVSECPGLKLREVKLQKTNHMPYLTVMISVKSYKTYFNCISCWFSPIICENKNFLYEDPNLNCCKCHSWY